MVAPYSVSGHLKGRGRRRRFGKAAASAAIRQAAVAFNDRAQVVVITVNVIVAGFKRAEDIRLRP